MPSKNNTSKYNQILTMKNNVQVELQTALSSTVRKKLTNFFKSQSVDIQTDIFKEQKNQYFVLKNKFGTNETISLSAFFISVDIFYQQERLQKKKNKSQDLHSLVHISDSAIKKFRKDKPKEKREKLLNLISVIKKLRTENFSFRQISQYLRSKHRLDVSHSYIRQIWEELND